MNQWINEWMNKYLFVCLLKRRLFKRNWNQPNPNFLLFPHLLLTQYEYFIALQTSLRLILHWDSVSYYTSTIHFNLYGSKTHILWRISECQGKQNHLLHPILWVKYHLLFKGRRWGDTVLFAPTLPDGI